MWAMGDFVGDVEKSRKIDSKEVKYAIKNLPLSRFTKCLVPIFSPQCREDMRKTPDFIQGFFEEWANRD